MDQKKNIKFSFLIIFQFLNFSIFLFIINFDFFKIDKLIKFSFKIFKVAFFFSTKVTFFAPLDIHSIPKDPIPEYKSKTFEFLILF